MSFFNIVRRALPVTALLLTSAFAQSCWYPDGTTQSSDIACNPGQTDTACCSAQSFCLSGGLCLTGGVVTRGSCSDKTWSSSECSSYCKTVDTNGESIVTPCNVGISTNTFTCGLDNSKCKDSSSTFTLSTDTQLILRPAQVQALVGDTIASGVSASHEGFSAGDLVGTAFGVGIPLLIAFGVALYLLLKEKRRNGGRGPMMRLRDDDYKGSIMIRPAPSMLKRVTNRTSFASRRSSHRDSHRDSNRPESDKGSVQTAQSARTAAPKPVYIPSQEHGQRSPMHSPIRSTLDSTRGSHIPSFAERIEGVRAVPQLVDVRDSNSNSSRHELDSTPSTPMQEFQRTFSADKLMSPTSDDERFELAASRMSR